MKNVADDGFCGQRELPIFNTQCAPMPFRRVIDRLGMVPLADGMPRKAYGTLRQQGAPFAEWPGLGDSHAEGHWQRAVDLLAGGPAKTGKNADRGHGRYGAGQTSAHHVQWIPIEASHSKTGRKNVRSQLKKHRDSSANLNSAWHSGSAMELMRYCSYAASDGKENDASAMLLAPSEGSK